MYNTSSTSPAAAIGRRLFGTVRRRSPFFKALAWLLAVQMAFFGLAPAALAAAPLPVPDGWDASGYVSGSTMSLPHGSYNWNDFSIGSGDAVEFTGTGTALNKVTGGIQSEIYGRLSGDNVFLLNPAGILFGNGASVDVNGLIAAAASMTEGPDGFTFTGIQGDVTVTPGATINASSYAYLVGRSVYNAGPIHAPCVSIAATGDAMTAEGETADSVTIATAANGAAITFNFADPDASGGPDNTGDITHSGDIRADTVNASALGNVTVESASSIIAGGDLAITAGGTTGIRLDGKIIADGSGATATFSAPAGKIDAQNVENDFATLSAEAKNDVVIYDKDDLVVSKANSDDGTVGIGANGLLTVQEDGVSAGDSVALFAGDGKVILSGPVVGGNGTYLIAMNGVEGAGAVGTAGAELIVSSVEGDINLTGTVLAGTANLTAHDISVDGANNDFSIVTATATDGSVAIRDANDLQIAEATATEDISITAGGNVTGDYDSTISAGGDLAISAGGTTGISLHGTILADGEGATATFTAPEGGIDAGDMESDFATLSATAKGNIVICEKDDLVVSKASSADGYVDLMAENGMTIQGDGVSAGTTVDLNAYDGKVLISAPVAGGNSTYIYGNNGVEGAGALGTAGAGLYVGSSEGDINLTGTLLAGDATFAAPAGAIDAGNAETDFATLSATAGGDIHIYDKNDLVVSKASSDDGYVDLMAENDMTIQGDGISAGDYVFLHSYEGKLVISAPVAGDTVGISAGNGVEGAGAIDAVGPGLAIRTSGDINLTGTVLAENAYFEAMDVSVDGADNDFGAVVAYAGDGSVAIRDANDLQVGGYDLDGIWAAEDIRINAGGNVTGGHSSTLAAGGDLAITAGGETGIDIGGTILADGEGATTTLSAPQGGIWAGNSMANDFATLSATAKNDVLIGDKDDLVVSKASSDDGDVGITAGGGLTVQGDGISAGNHVELFANSGKTVISGPVAGGTGVKIGGKNGVEGAGAVGTAGAALIVSSEEGDLNLTGTLLGGDATFAAPAGEIWAGNEENDFATLTAEAKNDIRIWDKDDLVVSKANSYDGTVEIATGGDMTIQGDGISGDEVTLYSYEGKLVISAPVAGNGGTEIVGKNGVEGAGALGTAGTFLEVYSAGDINLTGTLLAEDAWFEAKDISVYGANNDFEVVLAKATDGSIAIRDANDLTVFYADATEDIRIVANGALETVLAEEGESYVSAGGNVLLKSETDAVTLGSIVGAEQNLTISSGGAMTANAPFGTRWGDLLVDAGGDITLGDAAIAGNTMALLSGGGITTGETTAELLYTESAAGTTVVPDTPGVALTVTEVLEDPIASTATRVLRPGPGPGPGPGPSPEPPTPEPPAPVPAAPTDGGKTPSRTTATAEALPAGGVPPIADDPQEARELNRALAFMVGTTDTAAGADPATAAGAYPGATLPGGVDTLRFGVATGLLAGFQTAPLGQGWTPPPALTPTHLRALLSTPTLPPDTLLLAD